MRKIYTWVTSFVAAWAVLNMAWALLGALPAKWVDIGAIVAICTLSVCFADYAVKLETTKRAAKAAPPTLQPRQ